MRFTSSANFSCLDSVRHTNCEFHRVCAFSCATPRVCVPFFPPSYLPDWHPLFSICGYEVWRTFPLARPPIRFINRPQTDCPLAPTALQIWFHFGFFFLVAGNSALITLRPSGSRGLQVSVLPFTFPFYSYICSMCARESDAPRFHFFFHF